MAQPNAPYPIDSAPKGPTAILVVDDEEPIQSALKRFLSQQGYEVSTASNGAGALDVLNRQKIACVLLDVRMPDANGLDLVPKILEIEPNAAILMLTAVVSTALSVVREKERGTMEQLRVTSLTAAELLVGKTLPYLAISLMATVIILTAARVLFGVVIRGPYPDLFLATLIYLIGALGWGLLVSSIAETQALAFQIGMVTSMLPAIFLSGFIFPIRSMPVPIQALTYAVPARYFLVIIRGIILKGAGLAPYWKDVAFLVLYASVVLTMAYARLRRREGRAHAQSRARRRRRAGRSLAAAASRVSSTASRTASSSAGHSTTKTRIDRSRSRSGAAIASSPRASQTSRASIWSRSTRRAPSRPSPPTSLSPQRGPSPPGRWRPRRPPSPAIVWHARSPSGSWRSSRPVCSSSG